MIRLYQNQILFLNFPGFFGSEMIRKIVTKYCFRFVFLSYYTFFKNAIFSFAIVWIFSRSYVMLESKNICFDKIQEAFMNEK